MLVSEIFAERHVNRSCEIYPNMVSTAYSVRYVHLCCILFVTERDGISYVRLCSGFQTTFSRDLEPEYLALSKDGKTVYVSLQENCAIAIFDLDTEKITDIKPLAVKAWANTDAGLDASNKDDAINMQKWKIHGMLMADTIDIYTASDGKEYLVTANEGDDKEYIWGDEECVWTEMMRGKDLVAADLASAGPAAADVADQKKLGRIKIGQFDQRASGASGAFSKIYTMGGRSFSIIDAKTMATVYDSGSKMEEILKSDYPKIFNSEAETGATQESQKDGRSVFIQI